MEAENKTIFQNILFYEKFTNSNTGINICGYVNIKSVNRATINKRKRQPMEWEKILQTTYMIRG